jgi:hypothetical protein
MYIYYATKLGKIMLCSKDCCCQQGLFSKELPRTTNTIKNTYVFFPSAVIRASKC